MRIGTFAGLAACLTLVVVAASATIRLGADSLGGGLAVVRGVHRAAASTAALLVLVVFWRALRVSEMRRAASVAFVLMLALSAVGWATGTHPPPAAALFNQLGGVALAALLAWLAGRAASGEGIAASDQPLALAALLLASAQIVFGGTLVMLGLPAALVLVVAHAVLGLSAAATSAALGARIVTTGDTPHGVTLMLCAALAPLAGSLSVLPAPAIVLQVGHATAAALLLVAVAHLHGRLTRSA